MKLIKFIIKCDFIGVFLFCRLSYAFSISNSFYDEFFFNFEGNIGLNFSNPIQYDNCKQYVFLFQLEEKKKKSLIT